jgi:hypothetical protein
MAVHNGIRIRIGSFVGAMLTLSLIVVFYLGWKLAGLPFIPFDVFDWTARVLPGRVLALGIDTMVKVIRALNIGPTDVTAKTAEQAMAVVGMFVAGVIAAAVLSAISPAICTDEAPAIWVLSWEQY